MSHEPTREEWVAAAVAYANARQAAGKTMDSGPLMQNALTAANALRDKRIRNEALETAAREIDCGCPERDAVLAAKTRADRRYACSHSECCAELAADIRALKDKEPNHE